MSNAISSTEDFDVIAGDLYDDDWTSRSLQLRLTPSPSTRRLAVTLWNPPFNPGFRANPVKLTMNGASVFANTLTWAQGEMFELTVPANTTPMLHLTSQACLEPDVLDQRERALKFKLTFESA